MKLHSKYRFHSEIWHDAISNDQTVQYLWRMHKAFMQGKTESFAELNADLYSKYKESLSNEIKWDIVIVNIPLIFHTVHKKWDERFDFSDLLQEGLMGASKGVEKYREGSGSTLVTIIRIYTFKMIQEYIDKYHDRCVVHSVHIVKRINREKKEETGNVDGLFTHIFNTAVEDPVNTLIVNRNQRESKVLLDFIDASFDDHIQDIFYAYYHLPYSKRASKKRKEFEDVCTQYQMTVEEGEELALITHSTIKQHYHGIHKNSL